MTSRKSYNRAFKEKAVQLAQKSGVTQVASDPGIHPNMIYIWKRQLAGIGDKVFPGNGQLKLFPIIQMDMLIYIVIENCIMFPSLNTDS
ncbi:hypothetical protein DCM91_12390 [Chitinophaga costaii]|uniref:transposase n=1 Tax=Chitinophaga costaii TaxID=1335309 RepID=UPI000B7E4C4D|nr:hypothetical protein DCM91_12390 [Chitinophaga costaii]